MRYAIRSLLKAREFTLVAVAIVAIGIGANTAVFSIVDAALLRPLPFKDPPRLFILSGSNPKRAIVDGPFSYPSFVELPGLLVSSVLERVTDSRLFRTLIWIRSPRLRAIETRAERG